MIFFTLSKAASKTRLSDQQDIDFQSCEQMRESGWTEKEIHGFMEKNNGYYDEDYEDKT